VPRDLDLPWSDPRNHWARFAGEVARVYAGRVDDWIIWNEPDIRAGDSNDSYLTWAGGVEDYYRLLRAAYPAIKAANPEARVHLAGLTYWADREAGRPQYLERLLDLIVADPTAAQHDHYFDVATLHLYSDPRALYHAPRLYRDLMLARGLDKPIWIGETNALPWDDPTNAGTSAATPSGRRCTLADQASFLLQAFALGLAGGAEHIAAYKAQDNVGVSGNEAVDPAERAALVREDGSLRPAYVAYQTVVRYLQEGREARYFPGASAEAVVVDRPWGKRITVLWNAAPYPVVARLPRAGGAAQLVDAAGQVHALDAAPHGEYALLLPPATCNTDLDEPTRYLMGGETYLLVEEAVPAERIPAAPRVEPWP
jgi:hypothetical protein